MGPSKDNTGFKQGGINSSDFSTTILNSKLLKSKLGVDIDSCVISGIGQADDVMLVTNDIYDLQLLVRLTENYCKNYRGNLPRPSSLLTVLNHKRYL